MKKDNVTQISKGLHKDNSSIDTPKGTYQYALNAVNEVFDGNQSSISNERANEACGYIPLDHVFLHSLIIDNERTLIFSVSEDESISEIGLFTHSKCEYEELIRTSCLGFRLKNLLDSTYRLRRNCEETAYFTDGKEEVKRINISDLSEYYSEAYKQWLDNPIGTYIGEKWNCNKMNLFPSYKIPCINKLEVKTGGDIPPGTYNFAVQLLNKDREGTPFIYSSQLVPIYNDDPSEGYWHIQGSSHIDADDLGGGSNSNKTITFELDNLDSNYSYYRIAVIGADNGSGDVSRVYYSPDFKINKTGSNVFLYDGNLQGYTNGSVEEVKATKDNYKTASHIEQSNNRLLLADLKGYDYPWCSFQQYASKIVSNFITKDFKAQDANDLGNPKNPNTYFLNRGYQGGDVYAFGIVYVFKNGLESPVYHIPGRPLDKWYDIRNQNIVATNLPDTLLSTDPQDYEFLDPGDTPERYKVYDTSQPVPALNYGGMAYHQSEVSKYDDRLDCNGLDFWGGDFTNTRLKDTRLRHHKFPSRGNLETRQALGGDDINTSSAVVLNLFYQDGVTAFPSGVTTITVTINYFVNSIAQTPIVLNVVEADMEIIDQILATHPVGTWLITGISVVITGLANPELTFDVGAYVRSESQEWNTNSAGRLLGIEFDNIDYPHPDIVGHYFVRGDRDEANRTVIDSGIMGNLRVGQPQAIKYSTFSYFTNNDNGIADDKRHNYLFTPKFLYKRESKKGDYIRLENHFDFASGSISSETYDESGSGVREVDISIATRVQTYSGGTLHAGAAGQNWKIIRQVVLDGATYNDGTFQNGTRTYNISQSKSHLCFLIRYFALLTTFRGTSEEPLCSH